MARPDTPPVVRLSRQVWIRAALIQYVAAVQHGDIASRAPVPEGAPIWTWFALELFGDDFPEDFAESMTRNLLGIAKLGNDPRKQTRYVPLEEATGHPAFMHYKKVELRTRGPSPKRGAKSNRETAHYEIPIDLVAMIDEKLPGTAAWETAFLWDLANRQQLLSIETLRLAINDHLRILNLVRPSMAQRRHFLTEEEFDRFRKVGFDEQKRRYAQALLPLTECICPHAISLLAALCAESYLADNDTLFELHRDAMEVAIRNLLAHDFMKDVAHDFVAQVAVNILDGYGREFDLPQPSSLSAPLIPMEDWERQTGASWVSIPDLG